VSSTHLRPQSAQMSQRLQAEACLCMNSGDHSEFESSDY
jgi:hypothetical protein